jgi:hypothetical protein
MDTANGLEMSETFFTMAAPTFAASLVAGSTTQPKE